MIRKILKMKMMTLKLMRSISDTVVIQKNRNKMDVPKLLGQEVQLVVTKLI